MKKERKKEKKEKVILYKILIYQHFTVVYKSFYTTYTPYVFKAVLKYKFIIFWDIPVFSRKNIKSLCTV